MFLTTYIEFGYLDVVEYYSMVHPEWNLLLFVGVGEENGIVAYNMDNRKFMSSLHVTHKPSGPIGRMEMENGFTATRDT